MRPREVKDLLNACVKHPDTSPPVYLWGPSGSGKSSVVRQVAEENNIGFVDLRLALLDPTDLRGIPVPKDGTAYWLPPSSLPREGQGILFLDELNLAVPLTQASAYQLILDRAIGEYRLPAGWFIVAAGNKAEHGAFVHKMAAPLRNRLIHIDFEINLDDFTSWGLRNNIEPDVIGFLHFRPELLYNFDPKRQEDSFPTPRSWEFTSRLMGFMSGDLLYEAIEGAVGKGAAAEFWSFIRLKDKLPSIEAILAGEDIVPNGADLNYALVSTLATRAEPEQINRLVQYSNKLQDEFSVLLVKLLCAKHKKIVFTSEAYRQEWCKKHRDIVMD